MQNILKVMMAEKRKFPKRAVKRDLDKRATSRCTGKYDEKSKASAKEEVINFEAKAEAMVRASDQGCVNRPC